MNKGAQIVVVASMRPTDYGGYANTMMPNGAVLGAQQSPASNRRSKQLQGIGVSDETIPLIDVTELLCLRVGRKEETEDDPR